MSITFWIFSGFRFRCSTEIDLPDVFRFIKQIILLQTSCCKVKCYTKTTVQVAGIQLLENVYFFINNIFNDIYTLVFIRIYKQKMMSQQVKVMRLWK